MTVDQPAPPTPARTALTPAPYTPVPPLMPPSPVPAPVFLRQELPEVSTVACAALRAESSEHVKPSQPQTGGPETGPGTGGRCVVSNVTFIRSVLKLNRLLSSANTLNVQKPT